MFTDFLSLIIGSMILALLFAFVLPFLVYRVVKAARFAYLHATKTFNQSQQQKESQSEDSN